MTAIVSGALATSPSGTILYPDSLEDLSRNDAGITLYCLGDNILIENNDIFDNQTGINAKSSYSR